MKATARFLFRHKYSFILALFLATPLYIYAQSVGASGLVPCGAVSSSDYLNPLYYLQATSCNFCYLAKLIQNVVNFLVMVTIPISVAMFAWAGILFFTATGDVKRITRARSIFRSVLIGFIITITGWLVVQVVLQSITRGDFYSANNWVNLDCSEYNQFRSRNVDISNVLTPIQSPTQTGNSPTPPGGGSTPGGAYEQDSQARTQLQLAGIPVNKLACSSASATDCTSLAGIQTSTINQVINLKQACDCAFTVTGGTEAGHAGGDSSHGAGYKVDISLGAVDSYIQSMMTPIGNRAGDNAPQWRDQYGNIYAKEGNHWDIQVKAAGPLESRPTM